MESKEEVGKVTPGKTILSFSIDNILARGASGANDSDEAGSELSMSSDHLKGQLAPSFSLWTSPCSTPAFLSRRNCEHG